LQILSFAQEIANTPKSDQTLQQALLEAPPAATLALETPAMATAFLEVRNAAVQHTKRVQAQLAQWKARAARGLLVEGFGATATTLRLSCLAKFDGETREASGVSAAVASFRAQERQKLQTLVDTGITQLYGALVDNLQASSLKRLQTRMLASLKQSAQDIVDSNTQALRQESMTVETALADLQVPSLGCTAEKSFRTVTTKLNDAVLAFPDSNVAKLARKAAVTTTIVDKQRTKKPTQRSIDLGLDVVAMLRPDGFGSLQGYAGYNLGGNSVTFGVHNDADDPQTIAQFGGVRPPLLRVQPKLRVDVEL
jgi:hypothetical protein